MRRIIPLRQVLLALFVAVGIGRSAELKTLKGEVVSGELAGLTNQEIILQKGRDRIVMPLQQVVQVDFGPAGKLPSDTRFAQVELTDGSILHCAQLVIKEKNVELTLLGGQSVRLSLAAVASILQEAQEEKNRKEWSERQAKKRRRDVVAVLREGVVNPIEGTLGDGDAEGKTIGFTLANSSTPRRVPLANLHGLIFQRGPDPAAPTAIGKLYDSHRNLLYVSGLAHAPGGLIATTPAGARIPYLSNQLSRLDFSRDKLAFLSDLEPSHVVETSTEERIEHYRRDKNFNGDPIRLGAVTYSKGLSLHATTELEYDLKGEFREFRAVAGSDELVGGAVDGAIVLKIEGDGKQLYALTVNRGDKERFHPVMLNIKDVQKLKIVVTRDGLLDLGKHLTLADAKVSK